MMWKSEVLRQQHGDMLSAKLAPPHQHFEPRHRGGNVIPRVNGALSSREGPVFFFYFNLGTKTERGRKGEESGGDRSSLLDSSKREQSTPMGEDKAGVTDGLEGRASL